MELNENFKKIIKIICSDKSNYDLAYLLIKSQVNEIQEFIDLIDEYILIKNEEEFVDLESYEKDRNEINKINKFKIYLSIISKT